ncbi:hypothetical protein AYI68_g848 [Smittium mucronatum]|uniref:Uncharacterized protein n=1 Tax=Smittium mucronatum TaxID=133383 RepID=A0A1R0H7B0_9FUNG|nr:hypothetical protein AYI68_g848 [Smittium mucronatum]
MKPFIAKEELDTMISAKKTVVRIRTNRNGPFCQCQQPGYSYPAAIVSTQQAAPAQYKNKAFHNQGGQYQGKNSQNFPQKSKNTGDSKKKYALPRRRTPRYVLSRLGKM